MSRFAVGRRLRARLRREVPIHRLSAPAEVAADPEPRVEAATPLDRARAEGFLEAARRMEALDLARRLWSGRLAELFGPTLPTGDDAARLDHFVRIAGFRADAQQAWKAWTERPLLEAYAAGINAWIDSGAWKRPGFERWGTRPRLWSPSDSLLVVRAPQRAQGSFDGPGAKLWARLQHPDLRAPGAVGGGAGGWPSGLERPVAGATPKVGSIELLAPDRCAHGTGWRKVAGGQEDLAVRGEPIGRVVVRRAPAGGLLADLDGEATGVTLALGFEPAPPPSALPPLPPGHPARVAPPPQPVPRHRLVPLVGGA